MTYMPQKARKLLASGLVSAVIAGALSVFVAVAPASAAAFGTPVVSKPVRATDTFSPGQTNGSSTGTATYGTGVTDLTALIFPLDDSLYDIGIAQNASVADDYEITDDSAFYVRLDSTPSTTATFSIHSDDTHGTTGVDPNFAGGTQRLVKGTWLKGSDDTTATKGEGLKAGTHFTVFNPHDDGVALQGDDTAVAFNFSVNETGAYTISFWFDVNNNGTVEAGEPYTSTTVTAYGVPTLTVSPATITSVVGKDETLTVTSTGGALVGAEEWTLSDDSTLAGFGGIAAVQFVNNQTATASYYLSQVNLEATATDDTVNLTISDSWAVSSTAMTEVVQIRINTTATDITGVIYAARKVGEVLPATRTAVVTLTATTAVTAVKYAALTSPSTNVVRTDGTTTSSVADDSAAGDYIYTVKAASAFTTVAGTVELTNATDYGKVVNVNVYASEPGVASTSLGSQAVTTDAVGKGTWSIAIDNTLVDADTEDIWIFIGDRSVADEGAAGNVGKQIKLVAATAAPTATFTLGTKKWSSDSNSGAAVGATHVQAVGSAVNISATYEDQWGNALTGYKLLVTTGSTQRNASKYVKTALDATSVSYTDASTSTTDLSDAISLYVLSATDDTKITSGVNVRFVATPTLSALLINGVTPAARAAADYKAWVPADGTADAYVGSTTQNDTDAIMKVSVTTSLNATANGVVFTGSSGVRFVALDSATDLSGASTSGPATVHSDGVTRVIATSAATTGIAEAYFYCLTASDCTVTASQNGATISGAVAYETDHTLAYNVTDVKVNDVAGLTGSSSADKQVKVSFVVKDVLGNVVKTLGETEAVDVMISGVGTMVGIGSQGSLKTGNDGVASFYVSSPVAGSTQILLDGASGLFGSLASTTLNTPASDDKKTVTLTWSAAPAPEVVYAAPTLTVTKSGTKIILDGTAVEGEGDIIVYIKRVGTTKWVEQAATIEVAAPGDYNGMRIAPKSNVLIRVKQEGTGKFSNQVVVLK
jgi:hypothetical protein